MNAFLRRQRSQLRRTNSSNAQEQQHQDRPTRPRNQNIRQKEEEEEYSRDSEEEESNESKTTSEDDEEVSKGRNHLLYSLSHEDLRRELDDDEEVREGKRPLVNFKHLRASFTAGRDGKEENLHRTTGFYFSRNASEHSRPREFFNVRKTFEQQQEQPRRRHHHHYPRKLRKSESLTALHKQRSNSNEYKRRSVCFANEHERTSQLSSLSRSTSAQNLAPSAGFSSVTGLLVRMWEEETSNSSQHPGASAREPRRHQQVSRRASASAIDGQNVQQSGSGSHARRASGSHGRHHGRHHSVSGAGSSTSNAPGTRWNNNGQVSHPPLRGATSSRLEETIYEEEASDNKAVSARQPHHHHHHISRGHHGGRVPPPTKPKPVSPQQAYSEYQRQHGQGNNPLRRLRRKSPDDTHLISCKSLRFIFSHREMKNLKCV